MCHGHGRLIYASGDVYVNKRIILNLLDRPLEGG